MINNIPNNHQYIDNNLEIHTFHLQIENDVIVDVNIHIVTQPIKPEDHARITCPMAHCIQDIHDIIRQQYPMAEYNVTLQFKYAKEKLYTNEGWRIHTQSTDPSNIKQHFIRHPNNNGRHQLRCLTTLPKITPTQNFADHIKENTALLDAHYQLDAHPNIAWHEDAMHIAMVFPYISNATLDVKFSHFGENVLIHTIKLHTPNYELTIGANPDESISIRTIKLNAYNCEIAINANMNEHAINTFINTAPVTANISHHQYIDLMHWLRQLPSIYDEQIAPLVTDATTLFHSYYVLPTPTN